MLRPTLGFFLWLSVPVGAAGSGAEQCGDAAGSGAEQCGDEGVLMQHKAVMTSPISKQEAAMEEDLALAQRIDAAVTKLPVDSSPRRLLSSFLVCGACSSLQRLGEKHDGGYLTCMDDMDGISGILSVGVSGHDGWSQMAQGAFRAPVGQFDCTAAHGAQCGDGCTFYRECLRSVDNHENLTLGPSVTLGEALDRIVGPGSEQKAVLGKIDIEGSEWPIFEAESRGQLRRFRQLIVEFHSLGNVGKHAQHIAAVERLLDAGFKVVHLHGNNCCGMYRPLPDLDLAIPAILEVTFVADAPRAPKCESAPLESSEDSANLPRKGGLPPMRLK